MISVLTWMTVSVIFSFLCSILEAVLLSITPTFMNVQLKEKASFAPTLQKLKEDVDKPLIAILTLNTLAHTVGAIGVGTAAETAFPGQSWSVFGIHIPVVGIISAIMTFVILVFSEIIPKTLGATFWKSLAGPTTSILNIMVKFMKYTGMMFVLNLFTKFLGKKEKSVLSRADYAIMTEMVSEQGVLKENESTIIQNLLKFNQIKVSEHFTPRNVVKSVSEETTINEYYQVNKKELPFSRIPVYKMDNSDEITGYVLKDEILYSIAEGWGDKKLSEIKRDIVFVREDMPMPQLLNKLLEKGPKGKNKHIAIVTDDFGQMKGVISMEDVMETLLGLEIVDEMDNAEDMRELAKDQWKERSKNLDVVKDASEEVIPKEGTKS